MNEDASPPPPKVQRIPEVQGETLEDAFKGLSSGEDLEVVTYGHTGTENFWGSLVKNVTALEGSAFGPSFLRDESLEMGDPEWGPVVNPPPPIINGILGALGTGVWAGEVLTGTSSLIKRLEGLSTFSAGTFVVKVSGQGQFTLGASSKIFFTPPSKIGTTVFIPTEAASQISSILASPECEQDGQWMVLMRVVR